MATTRIYENKRYSGTVGFRPIGNILAEPAEIAETPTIGIGKIRYPQGKMRGFSQTATPEEKSREPRLRVHYEPFSSEALRLNITEEEALDLAITDNALEAAAKARKRFTGHKVLTALILGIDPTKHKQVKPHSIAACRDLKLEALQVS